MDCKDDQDKSPSCIHTLLLTSFLSLPHQEAEFLSPLHQSGLVVPFLRFILKSLVHFTSSLRSSSASWAALIDYEGCEASVLADEDLYQPARQLT